MIFYYCSISFFKKVLLGFVIIRIYCSFAAGEMAERFNAAVLKTVVGKTTGGSNPSLSA